LQKYDTKFYSIHTKFDESKRNSWIMSKSAVRTHSTTRKKFGKIIRSIPSFVDFLQILEKIGVFSLDEKPKN